ncbi:MAG: ComEC/Rec2 family competence protein, partial [Candidatus Omnitrophica bacterium]|nr:ComEC/Rec2 family competence protein [Candidatus Omnitrophota bacterium]
LPCFFLGRRAAWFVVAFVLGLFLTNQKISALSGLKEDNLPGRMDSVKGMVLAKVKEEIFSTHLLIQAEGFSLPGGQERSWAGRFLGNVPADFFVEPGQKIELNRVSLSRLDSQKNPGQTDWTGVWLSRGVFWQARSLQQKVTEPRSSFRFRLVSWLRRRVEKRFAYYLKGFPEEAKLLQTITLGGIRPPSFLRVLGLRTGSYHLLVISGLHVGFLFFLWFVLSFPLRRRFSRYHRVFSLAGLILVWVYVGLTGLQLPVLRAGLMISFFLLGEALSREISGIHSVALAALVILLANPLALFEAGFQLSFVATFGILLTAHWLEKNPLGKLPARKFWAACLGAYIFVFPLTLFHFGQISLTGAINNLVLVPVAGATTICGFLFWWWPAFFCLPARWLATVFLRLTTLLARISPVVSWQLPFPAVIVFYSWLLTLMSSLPEKRKLFWQFFFLVVLGGLLVINRLPERQQTITVFSTPRVICGLVQNSHLVILAPDHDWQRSLSQTVLPFARKKKIRQVTGVFFSEISQDGWGAVRQIEKAFRNFPVYQPAGSDRFFPGQPADRERTVNRIFLQAGQSVETPAGRVELLSSHSEGSYPVYLIEQGSCRLLFVSELTEENSHLLQGKRVEVAIVGRIGPGKKVSEDLKQLRCLYLIKGKPQKSEMWCEKIPIREIFYLSAGAIIINTKERPFVISQWSSPGV